MNNNSVALTDRVAIITGAASGIGRAIAKQAANHGMRVVIVDIEEEPLLALQQELIQAGTKVMTQVVDVAQASAVAGLRDNVLEHFGEVFLLFNNAGVGSGGKLWENSLSTWQWVLGVNLWGVIHGIHHFLPLMIEQNSGYVVNTASIAGLMSVHSIGPYGVSKHAVVALSEILYNDLLASQSNVGVSVLCPSFVDTNIYASGRNSPKDVDTSREQETLDFSRTMFQQVGLSPDKVAQLVFKAIQQRQFYILPHPEGSHQGIKSRMEAIIQEQSPPEMGPENLPLA